jgi:hypothetical protein
MLTRDSWVWVVTFIGLLLSHLITAQAPPTDWSYMQWLQFLSTFLAGVVGWLSSSPLAGAATPKRESYSALGGLVRVKDKPKDVTD